MSEHRHTSFVEGCYRCDLNLDEVADAQRDQLVEWVAAGSPPLCPRCGGYRTADGEWEQMPTCAESPLTHDEICGPKVYADDVCALCDKQMSTTPPHGDGDPTEGQQR